MPTNTKRLLELLEIYRMLWTSADFESDFESDWFAVYQHLQDGSTALLSDAIVTMCYEYTMEWEEFNGD